MGTLEVTGAWSPAAPGSKVRVPCAALATGARCQHPAG